MTLKYRNTFVTVTSDRKEGKSGPLLANIAMAMQPCYRSASKKRSKGITN